MQIRFEDLRQDAQLYIWDEVRIYLVCTGAIEPREEDEAYADYEHRVYEAIDDYINRNNVSFNYDLCQMSN